MYKRQAPVKAAARTVKRHLVPQYTLGEEIANSITHGIGAALGIAALVVMVVKAAVDGAHPASLASAIIFGCLLYTSCSADSTARRFPYSGRER